MSSYNLQWSPAPLQHLAQGRYAHFFALVLRGEVLYIGKSFRCELALVIPECIAQLGVDHAELEIFLGRIRDVGMDRIGAASVDAIFDLLVFARKPRHNAEGKFKYAGIADLQISNVGCAAIHTKLRAENHNVFVSKLTAMLAAATISAS